MDERQKHIIQLEQDANRLVDELANLKREVLSYKNATAELDKTRLALGALVEQTQSLTQQTHALLKAVNEVGVAKIVDQLQGIRNSVAQMEKKGSKRTSALALGLGLVILAEAILIYLARAGH